MDPRSAGGVDQSRRGSRAKANAGGHASERPVTTPGGAKTSRSTGWAQAQSVTIAEVFAAFIEARKHTLRANTARDYGNVNPDR